jgi:hypothetical protein
MFGLAVVHWTIWKARNRTCFDKKNRLRILVKCFIRLVCLCAIGQVYTQKTHSSWHSYQPSRRITDESNESTVAEEDDQVEEKQDSGENVAWWVLCAMLTMLPSVSRSSNKLLSFLFLLSHFLSLFWSRGVAGRTEWECFVVSFCNWSEQSDVFSTRFIWNGVGASPVRKNAYQAWEFLRMIISTMQDSMVCPSGVYRLLIRIRLCDNRAWYAWQYCCFHVAGKQCHPGQRY